MRRSMIGILAMIFVLGAAFGAGAATVIGTRYDLSSTGTRSIQARATGSGGTTEVCVFCHTPHSARADAPLWNKADPTGPYTVYASDVLNALNITVESPVSGSAPGYAAWLDRLRLWRTQTGAIPGPMETWLAPPFPGYL